MGNSGAGGCHIWLTTEEGKEYELQGDFDMPITIKPEKEKKPLPKWCGGRQSWRKKKKKWRESKCRTTE